jgi:hypothetical protein
MLEKPVRQKLRSGLVYTFIAEQLTFLQCRLNTRNENCCLLLFSNPLKPFLNLLNHETMTPKLNSFNEHDMSIKLIISMDFDVLSF